MIHLVQVQAISSEVEEEVSIVVSGQLLTCFASYLPYTVEVGRSYQAELIPLVFGDFVIRQVFQAESSISRRGQGYLYEICGWLANGCLDCGDLVFCEDMLLSDFGFLDGKFVSWQVDRLDVAFI